jgi:hypothetical protein
MLLNLIASALYHTSPIEIIQRVVWTLTFAAQLIFLVVILGRGRAQRYPFFTASIGLLTLRLMAEILLSGRLAQIPLQTTLLTLANLSVAVSLLVLVELARRGFAGLHRPLWLVNSVGLVVLAGGVLAVWGPWPAWKSLAVETVVGKLRLAQLIAQKGDLFVALLTVGLGVLVVVFGRKYKAGWRSHTQSITIGLSVAAAALLALQVCINQMQAAVLHLIQAQQPNGRQEYQRIVSQAGTLVTINQVIFVAVLIWWIVWLWLDEPGAAEQAEAAPTDEPPQAA